MPAAAVILAPIPYCKVVATKLVVGFLSSDSRSALRK